ncbi:hypothetical protein ACEZDB_35720 [Streptacidiphilus sp. N1-3]|uniref:Uncharacterized protein n=1 Tax=Streptacidiphilus alkalitolerans TaxID=3342712 RepID=A0ABV6XCI0_9ACTN
MLGRHLACRLLDWQCAVDDQVREQAAQQVAEASRSRSTRDGPEHA